MREDLLYIENLYLSFVHVRLALQFTNCLLAQTGQRTYPCAEELEISSCLEHVDTNAWTSYTNFYTHTHNMCHFLK